MSPNREAISRAAHRIAPHIRRTPVIDIRFGGLSRPVTLKLELLQHSGSFKARGAFNNLAAAFEMKTDGNATARATANNQIYTEFSNLDQALTHLLTVQASIGSRMNELDSMKSMSESLDLDYSEKISNLQELDYAAAISAFMQQNMQLEAAQSSFSKISGLSLFNYIG